MEEKEIDERIKSIENGNLTPEEQAEVDARYEKWKEDNKEAEAAIMSRFMGTMANKINRVNEALDRDYAGSQAKKINFVTGRINRPSVQEQYTEPEQITSPKPMPVEEDGLREEIKQLRNDISILKTYIESLKGDNAGTQVDKDKE